MTERVPAICRATVGPTVLDLGAVQHDADAAARDDWLHGRLCQQHERVVGVDTEAEAVATLREQGYDIRVADATSLDLDVTADTVVAGELLEHVGDAAGLVASAWRHLRPGGRLVLSTPNPWLLARQLRDAAVNSAHVAWFGPTVLRQLLAREGFVDVGVTGVGPAHGGLTGLAQGLGCERLGETTWLATARRPA